MSAALFVAVGCCLLNLPTPLLVQRLLDGLAAGSDAPLWIVASLVGIAAAQAAAQGFQSWLTGRIGQDAVRDLRQRLYAKLHRARIACFDRMPVGHLLSRFMDDAASLQGLASGPCVMLLVETGTAALAAFLLFRQHWLLGTAAIACVPLMLVVFWPFSAKLRHGTNAVRRQLDEIFGHLKAKFEGAVVIKVHATEAAEIARFAEKIKAAHIRRVEVENLRAALAALGVAAVGLASALFFLLAGSLVLRHELSPGGALSATVFAALIFAPIIRVPDLVVMVQQARAGMSRLNEVFAWETESEAPTEGVAIASGLVELRRVEFRYAADRPVLHDVSMRLEQGMRVALVGPTGCGKTTLINLLQRFYEPASGEIRLGGVSVTDLPIADLRQRIGIVPQDVPVFRMSLADNIRYGSPNADLARVQRATAASLLEPLIARLPQGLDTILGDDSCKLSQGERQRVAIARVLCKDPSLVILDEATSSLDAESEVLIQKALRNLLVGRTSIVIAHRLATIMDCDRIIVLEGGTVAQAGSHDELMAEKNGLYRRLFLQQFGRSKDVARHWPLLAAA